MGDKLGHHLPASLGIGLVITVKRQAEKENTGKGWTLKFNKIDKTNLQVVWNKNDEEKNLSLADGEGKTKGHFSVNTSRKQVVLPRAL